MECSIVGKLASYSAWTRPDASHGSSGQKHLGNHWKLMRNSVLKRALLVDSICHDADSAAPRQVVGRHNVADLGAIAMSLNRRDHT